MPLESKVKKDILKNLRNDYPEGTWFKIHGSPYQERGIPDIIGCLKGRFIAFEIKRPDKFRQPTLYQVQQIEAIKNSGGISAIVTSYKEAKIFLKNP